MRNNKDIYYQAIYQIIETGHWITDEVNRALKELNVTEPQYNVMRILKQHKDRPLTVQEIQAQMVQKSSNVTRIIDKLIAKGYVTRQECMTNRRKMDINISQEGLNYLKVLDKKVKALHQPMIDRITDEDAQLIRQLISKLRGKEQTDE